VVGNRDAVAGSTAQQQIAEVQKRAREWGAEQRRQTWFVGPYAGASGLVKHQDIEIDRARNPDR